MLLTKRTQPNRPTEQVAPPTIDASRESAVRRVFRGGMAVLAGGVLMPLTSMLGVSGLPFAAGMAAFVLAGVGLLEMGRAAPHFLRFGSRGSQVAFLGTTALGACTVVAGLSNWIGVTFGGEIWRPLVHWSMKGLYACLVLVLLCVLQAVVRWTIESDTEGAVR